MTSNDHIKQLIRLSEENPGFKIIAKVDNDIHDCDDCNSWMGAEFGKSEIEEYWMPDDMYYFEDDIEDEIRQGVETDMADSTENEIEEEIKKRIDELRSKGEIKKAIFVSIIL